MDLERENNMIYEPKELTVLVTIGGFKKRMIVHELPWENVVTTARRMVKDLMHREGFKGASGHEISVELIEG